ncbi:MAG TPA: DUF1003 domain-containing protein [Acidothermaceae bacterium]
MVDNPVVDTHSTEARPTESQTEPQHHPAVRAIAEQRANDVQLRIADGITRFAGSMWFVYLHALGFTVWMLFVEKSPWPTLTLIVSLEAIFLSTFVMIGQNRQAQFQEDKADHDFAFAQRDLKENTELTKLIVEALQARQPASGPPGTPADSPTTDLGSNQ